MNNIKVKLECSWTDSDNLLNGVKKMLPTENNELNDVKFVTDNNFDYVAVLNSCKTIYPIEKVLYFQCESQYIINNYYAYYPRKYDYSLKNYHCPIIWYFNENHNQLLKTPEKVEVFSTILTSKYQFQGQKNRIDFVLNYLNTLDPFHFYNSDNKHFSKLRSYKGPIINKSDALLPYKYTFNSENQFEQNYFTEKIIDPILCECLCFYDGCPNLNDWIDPNAYVKIDLNDKNKAFETVIECIRNNEWEHKINAIRKEKHKILFEKNFLSFLSNEVKKINKEKQ